MRILVAGDYAPVEYRLRQQIAKSRFSEVFGEIKPIISKVDYSIVNFECPIANPLIDRPIYKHGPNIATTTLAIDGLKWCGFNMITLANNHIMDYGETGLNNVLIRASQLNIKTVGVGHNIQSASKTQIVSIGTKNLAIINCCEHEFSIASKNHAGANPLNPINQFYAIRDAKHKADYIIVIIHGGHEYFQLPSPRMQDTYRFLIDAGADAVINHHQHCFSGYELYNGKPIFYGIGNFCFDEFNPYKPELWCNGYLIVLNFIDNQVTFDIIPYNQCQNFVGIRLIKETDNFKNEINYLNGIINNRELLESMVEKYYNECTMSSLQSLEPYNSRLLRAAFSHGMLPSFVKGYRMKVISNQINCESHLDKLRYAVDTQLNKRKNT